MSSTNILVFILAAIDIVIGLLLLVGKVKLVIVYRDEDKPAPWPSESEVDDYEEKVDNYVKPLEMAQPPTLVETPKKRRGRPRKTAVLPLPSAL